MMALLEFKRTWRFLTGAGLLDYVLDPLMTISFSLKFHKNPSCLEVSRNLLKNDGTVLIIRSSTTIGRYLGEQAIAGGWASRSTVSMTFGDGEHLEVLAFWKPWGGREIETIREAASTTQYFLMKAEISVAV